MQHAESMYKALHRTIASSPIAISTLQTSAIYTLRLIVQAGSLILLGNLLSAEQFALFAAISATAVILGSLTNLGMNLLLLKEVSNAPELLERIISYALPSILLASLAGLSIYIFIVLKVFHFGANNINAIVTIASSEIVITPIISLISAIHLSARRIWISQLLPILQNSLRLIVLILLLVSSSNNPLNLYLYSYMPTGLLALLLASITISHSWPPLFSWRLPKLSELKESIGFGSLNVVNIATTEIDKTLIIKLIPASAAGMYVIGMRVIGAFVLPITALLVSALPRLFTKKSNNKSLVKWIFFVTLGYGLVAATVIWLAADIIGYLFHNHFNDLANIIRDMSLIIPGLVIKMAASNIFMTQKSSWYRLLYEITNILLLTTLFIAFCKIYGLQGAILAATCTEWIMGLSGWSLIVRKKLIQ